MSSKFGLKQKLSVFSVKQNCYKKIPVGAYGNFTTDPSKCQLYLPDLVRYIPNLFPTKARLFLDLGVENPLPDVLKNEVITLQKQHTLTTLITSLASSQNESPEGGESNTESVQPIELSVDSGIRVILKKTSSSKLERSEEHLYEDTVTLINRFKSVGYKTPNSTLSTDYIVPNSSSSTIEAQSTLLQAVRSGYEKTGVSIEEPTLVHPTQKQQDTRIG